MDGQELIYYLGSKTPKGNTWYFMVEGRDEIFEVWTNVGNNMLGDLIALRELETLPVINYETLNRVLVERADDAIEIVPLGAEGNGVSLATFKMISPYAVDVNTEKFTALVETLSALTIGGYVDTTDDLAQYGLETPQAALTLADADGGALTVYIGDQRSYSDYFMRVGDDMNKVFYVSATLANAVLNQSAFALADSFIGLVNIANVTEMTIETTGRTDKVVITREKQLNADGTEKVLSNGEPDYLETFAYNGSVVDTKLFKEAYTALIGITIDGELPRKGAQAEGLSNELLLRATYTLSTLDEPFIVEYYPYKNVYCGARAGAVSTLSEPLFFVQKTRVENAVRLLTGLVP